MKGAFLDSVGIVALWNERDQWHTAAVTAFEELRMARVPLFTTSYVLAECANALSRHPARRALASVGAALQETGGLIFPTDAEWNAAWDEYVRGHQGSPGLVDLLSFRVMTRLELKDAFTNDAHFETAGFTTLF